MHIAGVLVHAHPRAIEAVRDRIETVAGAEVHAMSPEGRFVVTVEGEERANVADALYAINALEGVLSACMVYEQSDSEFTNLEASQ